MARQKQSRQHLRVRYSADRPEIMPGTTQEPTDFSEYLWMAEDGADEQLEEQIEEEMELIEQDFLEAMFDELLNEEENDAYFVQDDHYTSNDKNVSKTTCTQAMQLPTVQTQLNPNAPEFIPRYMMAAS